MITHTWAYIIACTGMLCSAMDPAVHNADHATSFIELFQPDFLEQQPDFPILDTPASAKRLEHPTSSYDSPKRMRGFSPASPLATHYDQLEGPLQAHQIRLEHIEQQLATTTSSTTFNQQLLMQLLGQLQQFPPAALLSKFETLQNKIAQMETKIHNLAESIYSNRIQLEQLKAQEFNRSAELLSGHGSAGSASSSSGQAPIEFSASQRRLLNRICTTKIDSDALAKEANALLLTLPDKNSLLVQRIYIALSKHALRQATKKNSLAYFARAQELFAKIDPDNLTGPAAYGNYPVPCAKKSYNALKMNMQKFIDNNAPHKESLDGEQEISDFCNSILNLT